VDDLIQRGLILSSEKEDEYPLSLCLQRIINWIKAEEE
jgi:hypothetical protein